MSKWNLTAVHHEVTDSDGNTIARVPPWIQDRDTLARLMAAAPELCKVLEMCVDQLMELRAAYKYSSCDFDAIDQAEEILRKIRGEES